MQLASFGKKVFLVSSNRIYTLSDFQYSSSLDTEKQDTSGNKSTSTGKKLSKYNKPSTYVKGAGLNSLSFKIALNINLGVNPRNEIESWEDIKDAAIANAFILGKKALGYYKWLLIDIQVGGTVIDGKGNMLQAELSLKFDEYVRPGTIPTTTKTSTSTAAASKGSISISDALINSVDKSEQKRVNPNIPMGARRAMEYEE